MYRLGGCVPTDLTPWLSSDRLAEKTIMRAEVGGQLTHVPSKENQRPAARSLRHAKRMDVTRIDYEKLAPDRTGESSEAVRQRVLPARERQLARFVGSGLTCNADTPPLPHKTGTSCTARDRLQCTPFPPRCGGGAPGECESGAHPRILRAGRHRQSLDAERDEPARDEYSGVPSRVEVSAHDRGFGEGRTNLSRAPFGCAQGRPGGGDSPLVS